MQRFKEPVTEGWGNDDTVIVEAYAIKLCQILTELVVWPKFTGRSLVSAGKPSCIISISLHMWGSLDVARQSSFHVNDLITSVAAVAD